MAKGAAINQHHRTTGKTALDLAVLSGGTDALRSLLAAKAQVDTKDVGGFTPLITAVINGRAPAVKLLLDSHADVSIRNIFGDSALMIARRKHFSARAQEERNAFASIVLQLTLHGARD